MVKEVKLSTVKDGDLVVKSAKSAKTGGLYTALYLVSAGDFKPLSFDMAVISDLCDKSPSRISSSLVVDENCFLVGHCDLAQGK